MLTPMNFQICGRRTALTSVQLTTNLWHNNFQQRVYQTMQDVNDLRQRLTDVWAAGVADRALSTMTLTSGAAATHFDQEGTYCDTKVKTNCYL